MSENKMSPEALIKSIDTDLDEIAKLAKSYFEKVEKAEPPMEEPPMEEPPSEEPPMEGEPSEGSPEDIPEDIGEGEGSAESIEEYVKNLPDEDIMGILQSLVQELDSRMGGGGGEGEMPAEMDKADGLGMGGPAIPPPTMPAVNPGLGKAGEVPPAPGAGPDVADPSQDPSMAPQGGAPAPSVQEIQQQLQAAGMTPEELMAMAEAIDGLLQGGAAAPAAGAPGAAPAPLAASASLPAPVQKTLKPGKEVKSGEEDGSKEKVSGKDALSLAKSIDSLNARLIKMEAQILKKSVETPKESAPARTYADSKNLTVLEKSTEAAQQLSGMELANWLISEQRKGNRLVKSMLVTKANLAKSEDTVEELYKELSGLGLNPPTK